MDYEFLLRRVPCVRIIRVASSDGGAGSIRLRGTWAIEGMGGTLLVKLLSEEVHELLW